MSESSDDSAPSEPTTPEARAPETGLPDEVVIARYRARSSDVAMVRFAAPIMALVMVVLGVLAGHMIGLLVFWAGALVIIVRWLWVTMFGPRPLAFSGELTNDELRLKTMRSETTLPPQGAQSLVPVGYKRKGRGPRALVTSAGTFTLYPDGTGYDEFVGAITTVGGKLRVDDGYATDSTSTVSASGSSIGMLRRAQEAESADTSGEGRTPLVTPSGADAGLAPGVVAVAVVGSQSLADSTVAKLDAAGVTALALPSASGIGGVRITVKEEDRERAQEILAGS